MWEYYASRLPVVAFDFTVSRHRDGPDEVLSDLERNLPGDCWSGFQKIELRSDSRMQFAACWAHARRKIDECRGSSPIQVAKLESLIRMLYDVEDQICGADDTAATCADQRWTEWCWCRVTLQERRRSDSLVRSDPIPRRPNIQSGSPLPRLCGGEGAGGEGGQI